MRTRKSNVLVRIARALTAGIAAFIKSANRPSSSKIEFTRDDDGRPFRAYVRGPRSMRKPSADIIEEELAKAQAKWDSANR
jgi:hypothetical protein